jgi:DNA polymerase III delta prime subunit
MNEKQTDYSIKKNCENKGGDSSAAENSFSSTLRSDEKMNFASKISFIVKYKPYTIDHFFYDKDLLFVVKTLHEIDDLNILFVGSTGSGKTTLLYALIREYYGFSPTDNIPEHNIMFINNLKEQGINFYRGEMKTFCQSHSTIFGKKKMVIIDDMDNINEQSQQVFRNYIDKYKNNVNFITVCTNIQKVLESIQSRLHILKIPSTNDTMLKTIMENIIEKENIVIDNESKDYILKNSNQSIRSIVNNLEKIHIYGKAVDINLCKKLCTNISFQLFEDYFRLIMQSSHSSRENVASLERSEENRRLKAAGIKNVNEAIKILYEIYDYGYSVIDILDFMFSFVKKTDLLAENQKYEIIPILCKYITIFNNMHEDVIELALMTNNMCKVFYVIQ